MTGPTTPTPSPDAGRVALDTMVERLDERWSNIVAPDIVRSIAAHVSALEARALAAEGERDRMRSALEALTVNVEDMLTYDAEAGPDSEGPLQDAYNPGEIADLARAARAALTPPTEGEMP